MVLLRASAGEEDSKQANVRNVAADDCTALKTEKKIEVHLGEGFMMMY